jgi:hypothetical protein
MWALRVVDLAEPVEGALTRRQVGIGLAMQHVALQGAVEALVLAVGLRVVGPAMAAAHPQAPQPHRQRGQWALLAR